MHYESGIIMLITLIALVVLFIRMNFIVIRTFSELTKKYSHMLKQNKKWAILLGATNIISLVYVYLAYIILSNANNWMVLTIIIMFFVPQIYFLNYAVVNAFFGHFYKEETITDKIEKYKHDQKDAFWSAIISVFFLTSFLMSIMSKGYIPKLHE